MIFLLVTETPTTSPSTTTTTTTASPTTPTTQSTTTVPTTTKCVEEITVSPWINRDKPYQGEGDKEAMTPQELARYCMNPTISMCLHSQSSGMFCLSYSLCA